MTFWHPTGTEEEKEGGQGWTSLKTWCLKAWSICLIPSTVQIRMAFCHPTLSTGGLGGDAAKSKYPHTAVAWTNTSGKLRRQVYPKLTASFG
jgi:hypothetical protein